MLREATLSNYHRVFLPILHGEISKKLQMFVDKCFLSADSISSALLVGLSGEEGGGGGRIIFKFFGRNGRIEGLRVLILSQCLAVA